MLRTRPDPRGRAYEDLLERLDVARASGFDLEACWIAYAVLEDRLNSALALTGGLLPGMMMLGNKLKTLRRRLPGDADLRKATMAGRLLTDVENWKKKRNPLMHSMAAEADPWVTLQAEASALATEGRKVVHDLSSAVIRLKKLKRA